MAQEQQVQQHSSRCSNNSGGGGGGGAGGRLNRKVVKPNKVPQRGMGVAQLEKIILEQRQLKDSGGGGRFQRPEIPIPPLFPPLRNRSVDLNRYLTSMPQFVQSSSSSRVNVPLGTTTTASSPLSSIMNIQIEPPSIQSYNGGDKMVGMKRSYGYLTENIPIPSFNFKIPSAYVTPVLKPDESTSSSLEVKKIPFCREKSAGLGIITKDFLTLAPPKSSPPSHSRLKEKLLPSCRGQTRDSSEKEWPTQQPLLSFFPEAKTHGNINDEVEQQVDLSLKL